VHWRRLITAGPKRIGRAFSLIRRQLAFLCAVFLFSVAGPANAEPGGIVSRIEREPVDSRALAAIGYSRRLRALEIEFKRGGTYRYLEVPPAVHRQLLAAESKARFYNAHVRGKYASVFVRPRRKR
jgi:hypothetical protein